MASRKNGVNDMPKKTTTETADVFANFAKEFATFPTSFAADGAGRDAALKGLATARERTGAARETFTDAQARVETMIADATAAWSGFAREAMDAGFANADLAFDAFEKMLSAGTPAEAMQVQSQFVQTAATSNAERMRKSAEAAQAQMTANAERLRAEIGKFDPLGRMAA